MVTTDHVLVEVKMYYQRVVINPCKKCGWPAESRGFSHIYFVACTNHKCPCCTTMMTNEDEAILAWNEMQEGK